MLEKQTFSFDKDKMSHVILYFLEHINNIHLGRTKLMKLLYYVDFDNFEKTGKPMTGARYRKLPHGPVPVEAEALIKEMQKNGDVEEVKARSVSKNKPDGYVQHRLISRNAKFDASKFSGSELEVIKRVAACWADATGSQMAAASHNEAPWAATEDGKTIDYEMAYYRSAIEEDSTVENLLARSAPFSRFVSTLK